MKNKIEKINAVFDKYDPCHVSPLVNKLHADEYFNISVKFVSDTAKFDARRALVIALHTMFGEAVPTVNYDAMLKDLKHAEV